jgi:hypothetical protein
VEGRQRKVLLVGQVALLALWAAGARAEDGRASGTLTINGTAVALKYAYATPQPAFFDKNGEDVRVRLSDIPLPAAARTDTFELLKLARQGAARIVEVVLDAKGSPLTGAIYAREFNGMVSLAGMHSFTPERMDRKTIAGRLWIDGTRNFMKVSYTYEATFSATIPRPPTDDERAAALASPPARAVEAYLAALREGALPKFVATLSRTAAADYAGPKGDARFRQLRAEMPADARPMNVTKTEDGQTQVSVEGHQNGIVIEYVLNVVVEDGVWKIAK